MNAFQISATVNGSKFKQLAAFCTLLFHPPQEKILKSQQITAVYEGQEKMSVGLMQIGGAVAGTARNRDRARSGFDMDNERKEGIAYEYLCHLEEAKKWMEECIKEELPSSTVLEENLRNGVYFAKLGHFCAPNVVPRRKIFDPEHKKWESTGLHFRHTDNINYFLTALREIGLPEVKRTYKLAI